MSLRPLRYLVFILCEIKAFIIIIIIIVIIVIIFD